MKIVTGIGPRVGSSFVMNAIREYDIPTLGQRFLEFTPEDENPNGYWELHPSLIKDGVHHREWKNLCIKLWPCVLLKTPAYNINSLVILERLDKEKQKESTIRVHNKEKELMYYESPFNPIEDIIDWSRWCLSRVLEKTNCPILRVYTEDISDRVEEILAFMEN